MKHIQRNSFWGNVEEFMHFILQCPLLFLYFIIKVINFSFLCGGSYTCGDEDSAINMFTV